jgi:hypothetical protein
MLMLEVWPETAPKRECGHILAAEDVKLKAPSGLGSG